MSFFENTRKPVGLGGKIMVAMMNLGHSAMAAWGLQFLQPAPDAMVLDCGCGGGANIKTLLRLCPKEMCIRDRMSTLYGSTRNTSLSQSKHIIAEWFSSIESAGYMIFQCVIRLLTRNHISSN